MVEGSGLLKINKLNTDNNKIMMMMMIIIIIIAPF